MRIAVDFDGTIVENQFPAIGVEKPFAVKTLKQLASEGDDIILWTARSDQYLHDAIEWCESQGLTFFAVNSNYHQCIDHQNGFNGSRKIHADIFIDDRNVGGFPGWPAVYAKISKLKKRINREFSRRERSWLSRAFDKLALFLRSRTNSKPDCFRALNVSNRKTER